MSEEQGQEPLALCPKFPPDKNAEHDVSHAPFARLKKTSLSRKYKSGFGVAPILYILGLIGVASGVLFSNFSQVLRTNITVTNATAAKNELSGAATTLAATSELGSDGVTFCPPRSGKLSTNCDPADPAIKAPIKLLVFGEVPGADSSRLPIDYDDADDNGAPLEVGVFTSDSGIKQLDPWGHFYIYCRWENLRDAADSPALAILSAGTDAVLDSDCGSTTAQNDDQIIRLNVGEAINRAAVWQAGDTEVSYGSTGTKVQVGNDGTIRAVNLIVSGTATFSTLTLGTLDLTTPLDITMGGTGANNEAGARSNLGSGTKGDAVFVSETADDILNVLGATDMGKYLLLSDALVESTASDIRGTLLGATDVGTGVFLAATTTAGRTALGAQAIGHDLFVATTATAGRTALGAQAIGHDLFVAATATAGRTVLGAQAIGHDLFVAATATAARTALQSGTVGDPLFTVSSTATAWEILGLTATATLPSNVGGTSSNVTGIVGIDHGGTGQTTALSARVALGAHDASNLTTGTLSMDRIAANAITSAKMSNTGVAEGTRYYSVFVDLAGRVTGGATTVDTYIPDRIDDYGGQGIYATATGGGFLYFYTASNLVMTLDPTGKLGLGTATPVEKIHVNTGNIRISNADGTNRELQFTTDEDSKRWAIVANDTAEGGSNAGSDFVLKSYDDAGAALGTPLTIVRSTGNATFSGSVTATGGFVGDLIGNVSGNTFLGTAVTAANPMRSGEADTGLVSLASNTVGIVTDGTERLRVTATGSVGIGTTDPEKALHVSGGDVLLDNNHGLFAKKADGTVKQLIFIDSSNNVNVGEAGDALKFYVGTERAKIDSSGNLGIGTATVNQKLDVAGNINVSSITGAYYIANEKILHRPASDTTSVGVGVNSLAAQSTTGLINVALGYGALQDNTSGRWNVSVGGSALGNNTTGEQNVAVGQIALGSNTTGHYNTALGRAAMNGSLTPLTGSNNTAVGYTALQALEGAASQNTALGSAAGDSITTGSGNILIGYGADTPAANSSNRLNIGNLIFGDLSSGQIRIGNSTLQTEVSFDLSSRDDSLLLPKGADLDRPATGITGMMRYNTDDKMVEVFQGDPGAWVSLLNSTATFGSGVLLGTSTAATNPSRNGDVTTGLFSDTASTVSVATAGVERLRVTATGSIGIGTNNPGAKLTIVENISGYQAPLSGTSIHVVGADGSSSRILLDAFSDGATAASLTARKANGTAAAPSALLAGDTIFALHGIGYGTTGYNSGQRVSMIYYAEENWTDAAQGTAIVFKTTTSGGIVPSEKLRITGAGGVGIGTNAPLSGYMLDVRGGIAGGANGTEFTVSSAGTVAAPVINATTGFRVAGGAALGNVLRGDGTNFVSTTMAGSDITGAALTKTDDTNVTLTLGGTPNTALLRAASLTLGWTGQLAVGRGGTGAATLTGVLKGNGAAAFTAMTGTQNLITRWTDANTLGTGSIFDDGTNVAIGSTATGKYKLRVEGTAGTAAGIYLNSATPSAVPAEYASILYNNAGVLTWGGDALLTSTSTIGGGIILGTAANATNPQKSGDATTGFFSATATSVSTSITGTERFTVNTSGATVTGSGTATTSFLAPVFDVSSAGAMTVGATTQTGLTVGRAGAATTINGSGLTIGPTAWTATPTISGLITASSGLTANGALTANGTFTLGDNGDTGSVNTSDWDISTTGEMTGISGITTDGGYTQSGTSANTFTGQSTFSNATYSALFTGGNVGIGSTTPTTFKLEVAGDIGPDANGTRNLGSAARHYNTVYADNLIGTGAIGYWSRNSGSGYLYPTTITDKIGIGTDAPNNPLEVRSTTTPQFRVAYDGSNYATANVSNAGAVTLDAAGASAGFTLSDPLTMAADKGITMSSGTGQFSQTYTGTTTAAMAVTGNSLTTGTGIEVTANGLTTGKGISVTSSSTAGGGGGSSTLLNLERSGANANATHTAYGVYSNVTNTGTTSTNVGGYFSASGATNNYGLIVANGNVGIGTTGPEVLLDVRGGGGRQIIVKNTDASGTENQLNVLANSDSSWGLILGKNDSSAAEANYHGPNWAHIINYFGAPLVFGTGNTVRMTINGAGNVGIGTTSPTNKLHVEGTGAGSAGIYLNSAVPSTPANTLYNNAGVLTWDGDALLTSTSTIGGGIILGTAANAANPQALGDATTGLVSLAASTVGVVTAGVEALRVTATGSVGIGTTAPDNMLHIYKSSDALGNPLTIDSAGSAVMALASLTSTGFSGMNLFSETGTLVSSYVHSNTTAPVLPSSTWLGSRNAEPLHLVTNTVARMTIDSTGNVGIGTATPTNKLHVEGTGAGSAGIYLNSAVPTATPYTLYNNAGTLMWNGVALATEASVSGTTNYIPKFTGASSLGDSIIYESSSKIGIGTTTLNQTLEVNGNINLTSYSHGYYIGNYRTFHLPNGDDTSIGAGINTLAAQTSTNQANTAVGKNVLSSTSTGEYNASVGAYSMQTNSGGSYNSVLGYAALATNSTGESNSVVGIWAMNKNTTGSYNSAFGRSSLGENTIGQYNSAFGMWSLNYNDTGDYNTAIGALALQGDNGNKLTGDGNTAVGYYALGGVETTAANNTAIGMNAGSTLTTGSGNILIGTGADVPAATSSNRMNIGNLIYANLTTSQIRIANATLQDGVSFDLSSLTDSMLLPSGTTGQRPSTPIEGMLRYNTTTQLMESYENGRWKTHGAVSDVRLKTDIHNVDNALAKVDALRPVYFKWDTNNPRAAGLGDPDRRNLGFIAQELEKVLPEVVNEGADTYRTVDYGNIVAVAVGAIKELKHENDELKKQIAEIKAASGDNDKTLIMILFGTVGALFVCFLGLGAAVFRMRRT